METENTTKRVRVRTGMKGFENSYESLPHNQLINVRDELMGKLNWSISIFYYKKRGDTPIWEHEADVLHDIFSRYGIFIIN